MYLNVVSFFAILLTGLLILSCGEKEQMPVHITAELEDALLALSRNRIYFGHQSVGREIMEGVADINRRSHKKPLNIIEYDSSMELPDQYFAHSKIGKNQYPDSKCEAFKLVLDDDFAGQLDLAMMKFCYVDINHNSDIDSLFEIYKTSIDAIRSKYPDLKIVHITVPLKSNSGGWKIRLKRVIVKADYTDYDNIKRCAFNDLLRAEFKKDHIFDLAAVESTHPDGSRESFTHNDQEYYSLIHDYTYDGGHLNELGKQIVARELILFLTQSRSI